MLEANPDLAEHPSLRCDGRGRRHPADGPDAAQHDQRDAWPAFPATTSGCAPQDLRPAYDYWYRTIQLLQWQKRRRGMTAERWVLKTPMHLGHVDKIVDIFPDATFAQTHRDPLATIPSYASMIYELWRGVGETSDPVEAGRQTSGDARARPQPLSCRPGHAAVGQVHRHRLPRHGQGPRERRRAHLSPHRAADDGHRATARSAST